MGASFRLPHNRHLIYDRLLLILARLPRRGEKMPEEERWKELYRWWLSKRVDGRPPSRRDVDPLPDLPRLVANLMLLAV
jgi:hypothetical protein